MTTARAALPLRPPAVSMERRLVRMLGVLFVAIPEPVSPGLAACGVVALRLAALPLLAVAAVFGPLALFAPHLFDGPDGAGFQDALGALVLYAALAAVEETGRMSFVSAAKRPGAALALYTTFLVLVYGALLLVRRADLATSAWVLLAQGAASLAVRSGFSYPKDRGLLLFGLIVCHAAVYIYAPQLQALLQRAPAP